MQINTAVRYHLTPARLLSSKKKKKKHTQTINAGEGLERREPSYTVGGNCTTAMENSIEIPE